MILAVTNAIYVIAYVGPWKIQEVNRAWTRDLAIPVRRSEQLSYEATEIGSWSFVGSSERVRNECWSYMGNSTWEMKTNSFSKLLELHELVSNFTL